MDLLVVAVIILVNAVISLATLLVATRNGKDIDKYVDRAFTKQDDRVLKRLSRGGWSPPGQVSGHIPTGIPSLPTAPENLTEDGLRSHPFWGRFFPEGG